MAGGVENAKWKCHIATCALRIEYGDVPGWRDREGSWSPQNLSSVSLLTFEKMF